MTLLHTSCQRLEMEIGRATVQLPYRTLEEFEGGFAERVSSRAVFFAESQLGLPSPSEPFELGARIEVAVTLDDGSEAFAFHGVVAWMWRTATVPSGREAGVGVLVVDVIDGAPCFRRLLARPGSGGRVRIPGARVVERLHLASRVAAGIVLCPVGASPSPSLVPVPTVIAAIDMAAIKDALDDDLDDSLEMALPPALLAAVDEPVAVGDGIDRDDDVGQEPSASSDRLAMLTAALAGGGDGTDGPTLDGEGNASSELNDVAAPLTHQEPVAEPPTQSLPSSSHLPGSPFDADLSALDDTSSAFDASSPLFDDPAFGTNAAGVEGAASFHVGLSAFDDPGFGLDEGARDDDDDDVEATLERPPSVTASTTVVSALVDLGGVEAFPEAPPSVGRPFEAQSTDVDLLASISAADVVALDVASESDALPARGRGFVSAPSTDAEELPSVEADLLNPEAWPGVLPLDDADAWPSLTTELFTSRRLPGPEGWPAWSDLLDARTMGVSFAVNRRGTVGLEFFSWPLHGTKRYSGVGQGDSSDPRRHSTAIVPIADGLDDFDEHTADSGDEDVFSAPSEPETDPFAPQGTDPRLNVEGLVARHVRASHKDVADDAVVFDDVISGLGRQSDPDATRDEMHLPALHRTSPGVFADPTSGTDSGEAADSSSDHDGS